MARPSKLPVHPRDLVLAALRKSKAPLTAYELLEALKPHGVKGPPVIYRALSALTASSLIHRIQATGAYIACNCDASHTHALSVLTVCQDCKAVRELHDHAVIHHLEHLRTLRVALPASAVVELPVTCERCAA